MITFLFWNLNRKPLHKFITDLVRIHNIDVLILAECRIPIPSLLESLSRTSGAMFHFTPSHCEAITVFTRFDGEFIAEQFSSSRLTIRRLNLPGSSDVLLAAVHHPSKLFWREASQDAECFRLGSAIRRTESEVGHRRTILVGDFNMDPFESGIVAANGLNAVMSRKVAMRNTRVVQDQEYPFFYNPMWGHFGDVSKGPAGTYYYSSSEHIAYFWHMFDQVLIRPDLLSIFKSEDIKILDRAAEMSLVTDDGLPDQATASDHLPLMFQLDL